jgi:hypothetical protein
MILKTLKILKIQKQNRKILKSLKSLKIQKQNRKILKILLQKIQKIQIHQMMMKHQS